MKQFIYSVGTVLEQVKQLKSFILFFKLNFSIFFLKKTSFEV